MDNIAIEHCNQLKDDLYQQQWNDLVSLSMIHDDVYDNCIINVVDAPYNINDDLSEMNCNETRDIDYKRPTRVQTRSRTHQQQQQHLSNF